MIYSKSAAQNSSLNVNFKRLLPLDKAKFDDGDIYWHDQHDLAVRRLDLKNCLDKKHWDHLRGNNGSRLLLFYGDEYCNVLDINMYADTIKSEQIDPKKVYFVTLDENWAAWARKLFAERGVSDIKIAHYNVLLGKTHTSTINSVTPAKRFSALSRNYNPWRLKLFTGLVKNDTIKHFAYTFNNIMPYATPMIQIPHEKICQELSEHKLLTKKTQSWVSGMPYELPNAHVSDKWNQSINDFIRSTHIHVLVESHFNPFLHAASYRQEYASDYFSPAFMTEKTYRALFCKMPFIVFATPYQLKEMRELGYKTFHPHIDESYDLEQNDDKRLSMILAEIRRLAELPEDQFLELVSKLQEITEHNYNVVKSKQDQIGFDSDFDWIRTYMAPQALFYNSK